MHNFSWAHPSMIVSGVLGSANVTAIVNDTPSPDRENYRPISIPHILSKVYGKLVSHKFSNFWAEWGFLPAAQFAYRIGLGCSDALLACLTTFRSPKMQGLSPISLSLTLVQPSTV